MAPKRRRRHAHRKGGRGVAPVSGAVKKRGRGRPRKNAPGTIPEVDSTLQDGESTSRDSASKDIAPLSDTQESASKANYAFRQKMPTAWKHGAASPTHGSVAKSGDGSTALTEDGDTKRTNSPSRNSNADRKDSVLDVICGENVAKFYLRKYVSGSSSPCVLMDDCWMTPNEFQYVSGRESAKDWKRSIKHHTKSLKVLIAKGLLSMPLRRCRCEECSEARSPDTGASVSEDETGDKKVGTER